MVATKILLQQRTEALESLTHTLAGLDGADERVVQETAERARPNGGQVGQDYMAALFLAEMAHVLADQQRRIEKLEKQAKGTSKRSS